MTSLSLGQAMGARPPHIHTGITLACVGTARIPHQVVLS
jgi:hypothetical protein